MPANLENSAVATGLEKVSFIPISKKGNAKECSTIAQLHSSHMLAKSRSKFFKPGFNSMWTKSFQMFKMDLEKAEESEIKLPASAGSLIKQEISRKTSTSALLTMPKPLTVWITTNCGKSLKRWEYQTTLPASWEICMQVRKQQLELDMEQWTGSKLGKEYGNAVHCHLAYLTYIQSQTRWRTSWNQDFQEKYQQPQICRWHHLYGRKQRGNKEPLDESERGERKSWLKTQHSKN